MNLLRAGRIFVFEPPPGVKANMLRTFSSIPVSRICKSPNERARLYFLLAWFHAIIQERLRYAPLGWSKKYEFGESDLRSACDTVDTWLDDTAKASVGRAGTGSGCVPGKDTTGRGAERPDSAWKSELTPRDRQSLAGHGE